jgi:hypothetical protein
MSKYAWLRGLGLVGTMGVAALGAGGCGARTGEALGDGGAAASASCSWPASLDGDPASRTTCHASRAFVKCTDAFGGGSLCTTDGTLQCEAANTDQCQDICAAHEYVAACGGVGPGEVPDPPAGCRSAEGGPAGIAYYCCPCG